MHVKAQKVVQQGCFFVVSLQLPWPIDPKFSQVYFMHICWDTPSENDAFMKLKGGYRTGFY